ncbi:hypothetical protein ACJMK2_023722 [Sinanodonta woodiana]|uniref:Poly [ADP-ribose] polymerase n=1 Tax=Sinanodonta woodiana TaxID=1069815 RepID=A0ABD3T5W7_SINWO
MSTATPPTPYVLVQLQSGEPEYDIISQEFAKDNTIKVTKIERLENTRVSDSFMSQLLELSYKKPDFMINMRRLYNCTCIEKSRICEEGLDQTMSRAGDFGIGFYFSDSPIRCLRCSEFESHPERAVILRCIVILGQSKIYKPGCCNPSLTKPPEIKSFSTLPRYHDSVMGSPSGFNQYVVYESRLVKVEHIITIEVDEEIKELIQSMPKADRSIQAGQKRSNSKAWKYVAVGVVAGAVGFVATPHIVVSALGTVGFTSAGVAAGSFAAAVQATIGNFAAGSAFAMAQSTAATGVVSVGTRLAGGTIFGAASMALMKLFKKKAHNHVFDKKNE